MKEFEVIFNLLADDYDQAKKLSEPISKYFLADNMCTLESVRLKRPEPESNKVNESKKSDKSWLKTFRYADQKR
ncbi:MAG: hypothetical protein ACI9N9_000898 [Enterobacterales bacterium]|jgi:hypothetical protein